MKVLLLWLLDTYYKQRMFADFRVDCITQKHLDNCWVLPAGQRNHDYKRPPNRTTTQGAEVSAVNTFNTTVYSE